MTDTEEAREALEAAYLERNGEASSLNKYELFGYTTDIPTDVDEDTAISIAADVLENPPEQEAGDEDEATADWFTTEFVDPDTGWPQDLLEYEGWMTHRGDKLPYAPWTDHNAPAPCDNCGTTTDECGCSARFKWSWTQNYKPFQEASMCLSDEKIGGLVYIQREDDPFVFVDGDDVRCPNTGDVHPAFLAVLSHLGFTHADISMSGKGVHAYYRGDLPEDETTATWDIDNEPWGSNDDLPTIEIYSGKHVCATTGQQVPETPDGVQPWNAEVLWALLEANDEFTNAHTIEPEYTPTPPPPQPEGSDGGTTPEECIRALNRLDAVEVAEETIVREWTDTSGSLQAFLPEWGSSGDGGTANFVDGTCWVDTGKHGGRGGPIEMALIDMGELKDKNSEVGYATGGEFWKGYEHLIDLGFHLPEPPYAGSDETDSVEDYYDAPLDEYVDGDPWSDPDAMLEACLKARDDGQVAEDASPPTLALSPIVRDLLGAENMGEETQSMAEEVFMEELGVDDFQNGEVVM